jgi:hypothetical protein
MEPEGLLQHSQVPNSCPYPEPARPSPYSQHPTSWKSILLLSSHLSLCLQSGLFPSGFLIKTLYTPLPSPHTRYISPTSHSSQFYHSRCSRLGAEIFLVCRISVFCVQTFRRVRWRRNWPVLKFVGPQDNRNAENHREQYSDPRSQGF